MKLRQDILKIIVLFCLMAQISSKGIEITSEDVISFDKNSKELILKTNSDLGKDNNKKLKRNQAEGSSIYHFDLTSEMKILVYRNIIRFKQSGIKAELRVEAFADGKDFLQIYKEINASAEDYNESFGKDLEGMIIRVYICFNMTSLNDKKFKYTDIRFTFGKIVRIKHTKKGKEIDNIEPNPTYLTIDCKEEGPIKIDEHYQLTRADYEILKNVWPELDLHAKVVCFSPAEHKVRINYAKIILFENSEIILISTQDHIKDPPGRIYIKQEIEFNTKKYHFYLDAQPAIKQHKNPTIDIKVFPNVVQLSLFNIINRDFPPMLMDYFDNAKGRELDDRHFRTTDELIDAVKGVNKHLKRNAVRIFLCIYVPGEVQTKPNEICFAQRRIYFKRFYEDGDKVVEDIEKIKGDKAVVKTSNCVGEVKIKISGLKYENNEFILKKGDSDTLKQIWARLHIQDDGGCFPAEGLNENVEDDMSQESRKKRRARLLK
jgi:hypothetical protein